MNSLRVFALGMGLSLSSLAFGSAAFAQSGTSFTPAHLKTGGAKMYAPILAVASPSQVVCPADCAAWIAATAAAVAATATVVQAAVAVAAFLDSSSSSSSSGSIHFTPPTPSQLVSVHQAYVAGANADFDR